MTPLGTELEILLWSTLLYIVQILIPAAAANLRNGVRWGLGNRAEIPPSSGWEARAAFHFVFWGNNRNWAGCLPNTVLVRPFEFQR